MHKCGRQIYVDCQAKLRSSQSGSTQHAVTQVQEASPLAVGIPLITVAMDAIT